MIDTMEHICIQRRFFIQDPALRFSREFNCSPSVWREVWKRYKFLDYTKDEAKEYLILTLHQPISHRRFDRWIKRTEIYTRAQVALKSGAQQVNINYFKPFTSFILEEINKKKYNYHGRV